MLSYDNLKNKEKIDAKIREVLEYKSRNINIDIPERHWILSLLLPRTKIKILDIGPSLFVFNHLIPEQQRQLYDYHYLDNSPLKDSNREWITPHIHDASQKGYPFPDNSFDLIIAFDVIEHLKDTDVFLTEVRRILSLSGTLLLSTPNYANPRYLLKLL